MERGLKTTFSVIRGDITKLNVDAIVNAANSSLLGGGGVDGAIHRAAGPELVHECRLLGGCATGEAKVTKGYRLPARNITHTVGPVWRGGANGEALLLASCYRNAIKVADQLALETLAFTSISTGIFGYPIQLAAEIAIHTSREESHNSQSIREIIFCCFSLGDFEVYESLLKG